MSIDSAINELDVAIIGGGISGVYAGWRLLQQPPGRSVALFEGSDHIGGRLLSVRPPEIPHMVAELGGMRILPAVQPRIVALLTALNRILPEDHRIETFPFPVDQPQNIAHLRGTHLRLADFVAHPDLVPYQLSFLERGESAGSIIINAIEQIVPGVTDPKLSETERRQMAADAEFDGAPLYLQGFWNVLQRVISCEAFQLAVDAGGYSSTLTNWNAADAIPWYLSDFGVAPEYHGFRQGFQQVPLAVARLFEQSGGAIHLDSQVGGFKREGDGFVLSVGERSVRARALILAMPRRSLDLLAPSSPPLQDPGVYELIRSVTPRPLFKLFTTYGSPWWRAAGLAGPDGHYHAVESGRTVTDLPIRQTYYWPNDDGTPAQRGPAMLMASYDDGRHVSFWDGMRPQRRRAWQAGKEVAQPEDPFTGAETDGSVSPEWRHYEAPRRMVAEVARQLATVHGLTYTPRVRHAAFRDWGDDPFGGGWNSWNIGVRSEQVMEQIIQPLDEVPLYICGEAYSNAQGWVEGALQTADLVLKRLGVDELGT